MCEKHLLNQKVKAFQKIMSAAASCRTVTLQEPTLGELKSHVLTAGKYHGRTLQWVLENDTTYLGWVICHCTEELEQWRPVFQLARLLQGTIEEQVVITDPAKKLKRQETVPLRSRQGQSGERNCQGPRHDDQGFDSSQIDIVVQIAIAEGMQPLEGLMLQILHLLQTIHVQQAPTDISWFLKGAGQ